MHTRIAGGCLYHASVALGKPIKTKHLPILAGAFFIPEWGWVGSSAVIAVVQVAPNFRPRLGMSWFRSTVQLVGVTPKSFRPRLGLGWFIGTKILLILR